MAIQYSTNKITIIPERPISQFTVLKEYYKLPDITVFGNQYIDVSLITVSQSTRRGIQIVNRGQLPFAPLANTTYSLNAVGYQGSAPAILPWQSIPLEIDQYGNFNYIYLNPLPSATYLFALVYTNSNTKKSQTFTQISINTGADDIYVNDTLLPSTKLQLQNDYNSLIAPKTTLVNQSTSLSVSNTAYQTALTNLDTQLNAISDWNSTSHIWNDTTASTALSAGGLASLRGYFTSAFAAQTAITGSIAMADQTYRSINALDGTASTAKVFYRGTNDITTKGGAPNIANFAVQSAYQFPTSQKFSINLFLRPTSVSDNFDAMRYAKIDFYRGSSASATLIHTNYVPLKDRLYVNSTDSNAANVSITSFNWENDTTSYIIGSTTPLWYLSITLYNVYGPSDTRWFVPASALGTDWTQQSSSPFTGGGSGGSGGGSGGSGGGSGGTCPTPNVLLDTTEGQVAAKDIRPGMKVLTLHEASERQDYQEYEVEAVEPGTNEVWQLETEDGRTLTFAATHRFLTDCAWIELQALKPGMKLVGPEPGIVKQTTKISDSADVVKITIKDAHTYATSGLISHNAKIPAT